MEKLFKSCVSLLLVACMLLGVVPATMLTAHAAEEKQTIVYTSLGDSMTNGYCLYGYDGESGAVNYAVDTYANKFAATLAGYTGSIADDQVIFTGTKGTVDHRPLALSGMRAEDFQWALELDYEDSDLMDQLYAEGYRTGSWDTNKWYNTWGFTSGDYRTWADFCDYEFRYADAAAKILQVYNTGDNGDYFTSSYADDTAIANAKAGLSADTYFPENKSQVDSIGGAKYLQISTEYYQKSIADADVISLAVGNTNFGTHMLSAIVDVVMSGDMDFSQTYPVEKAWELAKQDPFAEAKATAMLESSAYQQIIAKCTSLAEDEASKAEIEKIVEYCVVSYITGYIGMVKVILKLNPDAKIIQLSLMNAYEEADGTVVADTLGELVDIIYTPVNAFLKALPNDLMASLSDEDKAAYADAQFYFADSGHVSCMVDVFGDDYYSANGSYVSYPGLLNGTEGYVANKDSIVRARFVEEIVCGNMIFAAMGMAKDNTPENIRNFLFGTGDLCGVIAYDMMTPVEKATYAATVSADSAKEYALYLAFENSMILSGTENITLHSLAGLRNIRTAFTAYYPVVTEAIGVDRVKHYEPAATVVAAGSNGALTAESMMTIMNAVETIKAEIWAAAADYHAALAAMTGHTSIEGIVDCDTCKSLTAHEGGDAVLEVITSIVNAYNEQMELLPYNVVAEIAKDQTGGLLDGADIKRLCEAEDYAAEVYVLIAEKSDSQLTVEQVKTLVNNENGVWLVADEVTGGQYGADLIKMAYEKGMLDEEQTAQIDTLIRVREATIALLGNESTFEDGVSGIVTAIDGTSSLAYLLAVPQTMSDKLYESSDMRGALSMNARCLLGTGAGGHPSIGGHAAMYNAVTAAYKDSSSKPEKELFELYGANMILGNNLAMNFYIEVADIEPTEDYYAVITKERANGEDLVVTIQDEDWQKYSSSLYRVSLDKIAAKEMADDVTVVVYNDEGEAVSKVWEDSVRKYAMRMLKGEEANETPNAELLALYVEILNYGAAAQEHFDYNANDLANKQLTDAQKAYGLANVEMKDSQVKGEGYYGTSLTLESNILMNFYFNNIPADHDDMYAIATYTDHYGEEKKIRIEGEAFEQYNSTTWKVTVAGLVVADCRQLVDVKVYDSENAMIASAVDSIESYTARKNGDGPLFIAIMKFAVAAYNTFH